MNGRFAPIVLKKSFLGDEGNVLGPLMLFALGDLRDHIVLPKNDHGPSYQRQRSFAAMETSKISFREIFGVVGFSTFSTISAGSGTFLTCLFLPKPSVRRALSRRQTLVLACWPFV
jgi:hypothetical protein